MKPELKLTGDMKVVDIASSYQRTVGQLFLREDESVYFRRAPFTTRLTDEEEIQIAFILDEINN